MNISDMTQYEGTADEAFGTQKYRCSGPRGKRPEEILMTAVRQVGAKVVSSDTYPVGLFGLRFEAVVEVRATVAQFKRLDLILSRVR